MAPLVMFYHFKYGVTIALINSLFGCIFDDGSYDIEASNVRYETGTEQASEFADSGKRSNILRDSNLAENSSVGPVEDVSEDFSKRIGQDVITEKERAKMLSKELEEAESERNLLKHEIVDLKNQVKVLSEKNIPELLKEMQEKFADQKGVLDSKNYKK